MVLGAGDPDALRLIGLVERVGKLVLLGLGLDVLELGRGYLGSGGSSIVW